MNKSCADFQELIKDRLAGELDTSLEQPLSDHLLSCKQCSREAELLQGVWKELTAYEDESVPSHFFVYDRESLSFWELLRQLSFPWRIALGAASACMAVVVFAALSSFSIRIEPNGMILSFGTAQEQTDRFKSLKEDLARELRAASVEERAEWIDALRDEFTELLDQSERRQQRTVKAALSELESRTLRENRAQNAALQARLDASLKQYGSAILTRHEKDMGDVRQQLNRFANYNRYQANQTGAIMATLVEMAETRNN